jgi:MFS family permease
MKNNLVAYLAISALLSLANWILLLLPNFLAERHWSSQETGWAIGCFFLVNLVFQILSGRLAHRRGNLSTALAGAGLGFAGGVLYLGALWLTGMIFAARVFHAAGAAMVFAGALMELVKSVPLHLRGRMIGYYGLPGFVMMGLGPMTSEWFVYRWGFPAIFLAIPLLYAGLAFILSCLPRPLAAGVPQHPFSEVFRESVVRLRSILVLSVFFGLCFSAWNSFLAPAVRSVGPGAVSSFGLGYGVGAVITRLGTSNWLDSPSRRLASIATLLLYSLSLALIPFAVAIWQLTLLGLVCGMVHGTYYPSLSSIAAERFHPLHAGQALSLYVSASAIGMFVGPPLWGAVVDLAGYRVMFALSGVVLAVNAIVFVTRQRRSKLLDVSRRSTVYH